MSKSRKMSIPANLTKAQLEAKLAQIQTQKDCEHYPENEDLTYDGQETHCVKCGCALRFGKPGKGKVNKSKKTRLKERREELSKQMKVEVVK